MANNVVLNILEDVSKNHSFNIKGGRPRIEHAQIIASTDIERFGRLNGMALTFTYNSLFTRG